MLFLRSSLMAALLILPFLAQTLMATPPPLIWKYELSAKINGHTADQVWPLVADFCSLYKILLSIVSFCVKGVPGKPGQIRYTAGKSSSSSDCSNTTTIILWVEEELLAIYPTKCYLTYQILKNNAGVKRLIATMQVMPIDRYRCQFKWTVLADPIDGYTYESFLAFLESTLEDMAAKLKNLFDANYFDMMESAANTSAYS